jgi:hypothetical protein
MLSCSARVHLRWPPGLRSAGPLSSGVRRIQDAPSSRQRAPQGCSQAPQRPLPHLHVHANCLGAACPAAIGRAGDSNAAHAEGQLRVKSDITCKCFAPASRCSRACTSAHTSCCPWPLQLAAEPLAVLWSGASSGASLLPACAAGKLAECAALLLASSWAAAATGCTAAGYVAAVGVDGSASSCSVLCIALWLPSLCRCALSSLTSQSGRPPSAATLT